jgi:hypothetical protein
VRTDAELAEWFRHECELDEAIAARLKECPVPADLRQAVVTGQRSQRQAASRPMVWWRSPALAWAAAIVLLLGAGFWFGRGNGSGVGLTEFREDMTAHLRTGLVFDYPGSGHPDSEPVNLERWLVEQGGFQRMQFPAELQNARGLGCKLFEFQGMKAALVCFSLPDREVVHLFVVDGGRFAEREFDVSRCTSRCNEYNTYAWRTNQQVFLLAGGLETDQLRHLAGLAAP